MDEELAEELALALELEELDDVPDDGGRGMAAEGGVILEPIDEAEDPALAIDPEDAIAGGGGARQRRVDGVATGYSAWDAKP